MLGWLATKSFLNVDNGCFITALFDADHNLVGANGVKVKFDMVEMDFIRVQDRGQERYYSIVGISECGDSIILEVN